MAMRVVKRQRSKTKAVKRQNFFSQSGQKVVKKAVQIVLVKAAVEKAVKRGTRRKDGPRAAPTAEPAVKKWSNKTAPQRSNRG